MPEIELRTYEHDADYAGLRLLLEAAKVFDPDYETPERLRVVTSRFPGIITIATKHEELVGCVYFQDGIIPTINRLVVRSDERRQGIGSALLEFAETRARVLGHAYLELFVSPNNGAARSFYEKYGYMTGKHYTNMYRQLDT